MKLNKGIETKFDLSNQLFPIKKDVTSRYVVGKPFLCVGVGISIVLFNKDPWIKYYEVKRDNSYVLWNEEDVYLSLEEAQSECDIRNSRKK